MKSCTILCLFNGLALGGGALAQGSIGNAPPIDPREALAPGTTGSTHLCGARSPITNLLAWSTYAACRSAVLSRSRKTTLSGATGFFGVPQRRSRFAVH